jgi:hypothetical protein
MFTGFLAKHLTHYEAVTHDHRYDQPGALKFTWPDGRTWAYSFPAIAAHCTRAFAESPFTLWPCEPNQIYIGCNQRAAAGVQGFDALHGTSHWERVSGRYQDALDHEWMKPSGDYYAHYNTRLGMNVGALTWNDGTSPMFMDGNGVITALGRTMEPEIAARVYLMGKNAETLAMLPIDDGVLKLPPAGAGPAGGSRLARLYARVPSFRHFLSGAWVDMSKSGFAASNAVMYAGIADLARQFGNNDVAEAAIRGLDAEHFLGLEAERPYAATVLVHAMIAKTRWARRYKQDDFHCARIPRYEGPLIASAPYPEVLVTYANGRDGMLCLTLEPAAGPGSFPLAFERLRPDTGYVVSPAGPTFRTAADGTGEVTLQLSGRTTVLVKPSGPQ